MARPRKQGLLYFPKDTDFYEDFRIVDLLQFKGALAVTVYDIILTIIYKNGYYIEIEPERLASLVLRTLGNRWAKKELIEQVIRYCSDIGLFDSSMVAKNVFTSVSIQRRWKEITKRNKKSDILPYWLIKEDDEPLESAADFRVSATETGVSATETLVSATETQQRKQNEKENKNYYYDTRARDDDDKLQVIDKKYGVVMLSENQINDLLDKLTLDEFNAYVERLGAFIVEKNAHIKSHYQTILKWVEQDRKRGKQ